MEVLLGVRSWRYAQYTSQNSADVVERVCAQNRTAASSDPLADIHSHSSARIFFARCSVMAKALGSTTEEEQKPGLHKIAQVSGSEVSLEFDLIFSPSSN
jgi:hypothetical protein